MRIKKAKKPTNGIDVVELPVLAWVGVVFGVLCWVYIPVCLFGKLVHPSFALATFLGGALLLTLGYYFIRHPKVIVNLSQEGLYIPQYRRMFPWNAIRRASVVSIGSRQPMTQRMISAVTSRRKSEEPILLMIQLTESGKRLVKDRIFAEFGLKPFMKENESVCLRLTYMDIRTRRRVFDTRMELAETINLRSRKATEADMVPESIPDPALPTPKLARRGDRNDEPVEESSEEEGLTGLPAVIVSVLIPVVWAGARFLKNAAARPGQLGQGTEQVAGSVLVIVLLGCAVIGLIVIPFAVISALPEFFRFLVGSKRYQKRWGLLQLLAWVAMIGTVMACAPCYFKPKEGFGGALIMSTGNSIPAAIGFYLVAMSFMPERFFERDYMGAKVMAFLSCHEPRWARICCCVGAVFLFAVSGFIHVLTIRTFAGP